MNAVPLDNLTDCIDFFLDIAQFGVNVTLDLIKLLQFTLGKLDHLIGYSFGLYLGLLLELLLHFEQRFN